MTPDAAQSAVIDAPAESSSVVIGAPGTGKTATLETRLVQLVREGVLASDEVLALTPTRQTATVMRDRLGVALGVATPGALARSIGSFAFQIVRAGALARGAEPPVLLTGADQDRIIAELLAASGPDAWPEELGAALRGSATFRAELREFLAECTRWGIDAAWLRASNDLRWRAVGTFLEEYNAVMAWMRPGHRETAELLREAASIVHKGESLGALDRLRLVLVDDAQELTRGGVDLVRALRERGVAVMAFGDPDIASGAFRGASPELFTELTASLGRVFVLNQAHRPSPSLRAVTARLTQAIGAAGRVDHRMPPGLAETGGEDSEAVRVFFAASPHEEIDRIAGTLRHWHLAEGIAWQSLAVIAHDGGQLARLEAELAAREVPTRAAGVQRPLGSEPIVRDIAEIVLLALTPPSSRDPELISRALRSSFGGLDAVSLRRLRSRLRHHELADGGSRGAGELLREAMEHPAALTLIDAPEARAAEHFAETLHRVSAASEQSAHELLWIVWDRARGLDGRRLATSLQQASGAGGSGAHRAVLPGDTEADRILDALVALFGAAKRANERSPGEPAAVFLGEMLESAVPEDSLSVGARPGTVTVLTPAAALGTEFEGVVIAGVQDGVWPNVRLRGGLFSSGALAELAQSDASPHSQGMPASTIDRRKAALHDELRLFVRAVSRARTRVLVTAVRDEDLVPSPLFALLPEPSDEGAHPASEHPLTLRGLVARHRRTLTTSSSTHARTEAAEQLAVLAREGVAGADPRQWYGMLQPTTTAPLVDLGERPVRVSPSQIESFEECAVDWVIGALGGKTSSNAAGIGTVLHAAMEAVPQGGREELRRVVDDHWGELEFDAAWLAGRERRRAEMLIERLDAYLGRVVHEGGSVISAEASFELEIELDAEGGPRVVAASGASGARAVLAGFIDRVELYPPGKGEKLANAETPHRPAPRAVVVDLKTGRLEKRYLDQHVADHAQLAAYQLAFHEGAVPEGAGADFGGSRLVLIGVDPRKGEHYRIAQQNPHDEQQRQAFLERIATAARGMAAADFIAHVDTHCLSDNYAVCRIHTIGAVSAP